jgi:hypothetical protein
MEQQFYAEVMAQLEQLEYNSNLGIGESGVTTYLHSIRNSSTDGKIGKMGAQTLHYRQIKRS